MGIRVIGGELRGRRLSTGDLPGLRPTTDRVRESMFNILASRFELEGLHALDLCAGSGALGIEALSRGAVSCDFVEMNRKTAALLRKNIESLELGDRTRVIEGDALRFLKRVSGEGAQYDLVLSDPPYRAPFLPELIGSVAAVLAPGGLFVLERSNELHFVSPQDLEPVVERSFGQSAVSIYSRIEQ